MNKWQKLSPEHKHFLCTKLVDGCSCKRQAVLAQYNSENGATGSARCSKHKPRPRRRAKPFERWTYSEKELCALEDGKWRFSCFYSHKMAREIVRALNKHRVVLKRGRS